MERLPKQGEGRLHGKLSLGFGGHVDASDIDGSGDLVQRALDRELAAPEVDRTIRVYTKMFSRVGALGLPKLVLGNYVISGKIDDAQQFFDILEKYLGLHAIDD